MNAIVSLPANTLHFIRTLTVVRVSFLSALILSLVSLGMMATGSTWTAMSLGLLAVFCIIWYCIGVEDTIKVYGRPQWW